MGVTTEHLENQAAALNGLLNRPAVPWTWGPGTVGSAARACVGNLSVESCLGSVRLVEMTNAHGAQRNVIYADTKAELYGKLDAMLVALSMQGDKP